MRKAAIACGAVGLVFFLAAGLLAFWITPAFIARLPADSNTTRTYTGTIQRVVNPAALKRGDFAAAVTTNAPQTIRQQVTVQQTSGNTALVKDSNTVTTGSGQRIGAVTEHYAVDRTSLEATTSHPSDWTVSKAKGLTVNWPIPTSQRNYTGWENLTQTTVPLKYVRQEQHAGINTYMYQATVPITPIKNPQVLASLPSSLPASVVQQAARAGLVPASLVSSLSKAFPPGSSVPLGYTYQASTTYWVAPATGIVVDQSTSEKQTGGLAVAGGKVIPVLPVLVDTYKQSPSSVQTAVNDANNGSGTITTWGTTVPIICACIGFILLVLAVVFALRGRRSAATPFARPAGMP
jgi:hypothetical protein